MGDGCEESKTRKQLEAEGWTQASITGGNHLKRTLQMYEELGIEVYLEEIEPSSCGQCTVCYEQGDEKMYRIYTR